MYDERGHELIDERWLTEWVEFGFREIDHYLMKHAEFAEWLRSQHHDR
jgi:hypothetical protein